MPLVYLCSHPIGGHSSMRRKLTSLLSNSKSNGKAKVKSEKSKVKIKKKNKNAKVAKEW